MEKHSNNVLIEGLELKNIKFQFGEKSKFNKYSYYQVINAYKSLFVNSVERIEDIHNNITKGIKVNEYKKVFGIKSNTGIFKDICRRICKKYGLKYTMTMSELALEKMITKINYVHHIYPNYTYYRDFLRMYKFEHELRLLLLRYTLIIEENVKNVFVKHLNNAKDTKANFLSDINKYDTSRGNNDALNALKLIFEKQKNKRSKPILRKRQQDITIPYWILINELTMNETYNVIKNLRPEISILIFQDCLNYFTNIKVDIMDIKKNKKQLKREKGLIFSFRTLIKYIGLFRNMLAHNQPIFCYNHKDYSLIDFPEMSYDFPKINDVKDTTITEIEQQQKINSITMYDLVSFFGPDKYNLNNSHRNINLGFIIYVIYKMILTIDKNTKFYEELINIYEKYNVILSLNERYLPNLSDIDNLLKEIDDFDKISINYNDLNNKIKNKIPYKNELKSFISKFNNSKRRLILYSNRIKFKEKKSNYDRFPFEKRYTEYTGIDKKYFKSIK